MFIHVFFNRLKCITRDKELIFWSLIFPLILGTFFYMTLVNISQQESFKSIDIAVVNNEAYQKDEGFKAILSEVSQGNDRLFNLNKTTETEAEKLLDSGKVYGYIKIDSQINLIVRNSGLEQTIIKSFLDEYSQTVSTVGSILKDSQGITPDALLKDVGERFEYTKAIQIGRKEKPDTAVNYFYTLIAMACFYGSFFGLKEITDIQADLSKRAARLNVAPVHKVKVLLAGLSAGYVVMLLETFILISYLVFVLKVDFGNQLGYIILTCLVACATGITFGAFVSAIIKKSEGLKTAILIVFTMVSAFLAGMMFDKMKYIVEKNIPILAYLNPVTLITDAFYALYYYDTHTRFFINIGLLSGVTVFFSLVTYLIIRRQKYASI